MHLVRRGACTHSMHRASIHAVWHSCRGARGMVGMPCSLPSAPVHGLAHGRQPKGVGGRGLASCKPRGAAAGLVSFNSPCNCACACAGRQASAKPAVHVPPLRSCLPLNTGQPVPARLPFSPACKPPHLSSAAALCHLSPRGPRSYPLTGPANCALPSSAHLLQGNTPLAAATPSATAPAQTAKRSTPRSCPAGWADPNAGQRCRCCRRRYRSERRAAAELAAALLWCLPPLL